MSAQGESVCVAHLVRRGNPPSALQEFLDSYARCPAGLPHVLLLIFKGFLGRAALAPYDACLAGTPHKRVFVSDYGFDVRPYMKVAREQPYRYFLFLNSFSRLLVPGWLELLYRHVRKPGVGVVAATGSHQSVLSDAPFVRIGQPAAVNALRRARFALSIWRRFPPFPNPHVRTNAFLAPREVLARIRHAPILTKWAAYRFESGLHSMTRQIVAAGLRPLIAGADGRAYESEAWAESRTFWISRQENLLVADNQTRAYAEGSDAMRERLAYFAWRCKADGSARPEPPGQGA